MLEKVGRCSDRSEDLFPWVVNKKTVTHWPSLSADSSSYKENLLNSRNGSSVGPLTQRRGGPPSLGGTAGTAAEIRLKKQAGTWSSFQVISSLLFTYRQTLSCRTQATTCITRNVPCELLGRSCLDSLLAYQPSHAPLPLWQATPPS